MWNIWNLRLNNIAWVSSLNAEPIKLQDERCGNAFRIGDYCLGQGSKIKG